MSKQVKKIVIVGGGSAGWMAASTLVGLKVCDDVTVIESPNIPTVGVGESTLAGINNWLHTLGIKDEDFMAACDATYKLSIRFEDFYRKGSGGFHYPFGVPSLDDTVRRKSDWYIKKLFHAPDTPVTDYADCMYANMALINANKICTSNNRFPGYRFDAHAAYHMNAVKFAIWLRDHYAVPRGVKHVQSEVKHIEVGNEGIEYLKLDSGEEVKADLFIDCTGFRSLLLGNALHEPFISYADKLPVNGAWACQVPYVDKRKELVNYTNCTAIGNGWVWHTPLWTRTGTGYVFSDKYITKEDALEEFKDYLKQKGTYRDDLQFRYLGMRVGVHNRIWVKNVCAIGLSASFIEPLESNGLYSVHEFLGRLVRVLQRNPDKYVSQWDKDYFNLTCRRIFTGLTEFIGLHYALSHRDDTEFWRDVGRTNYYELNEKLMDPLVKGYLGAFEEKEGGEFQDNIGGLHCIATGLNYFPVDEFMIRSSYFDDMNWWKDMSAKMAVNQERRKAIWNDMATQEPNHYDYLAKHIYKE